MDALILAGGESPPDIAAATGCTDRAGIPIHGRPMITWVFDALRATAGIERIAVVGSTATNTAVTALAPDAITVTASERMLDNAIGGMRALGASSVLVCTCDIPLVTAATFNEFISGAQQQGFVAAYPIVRRETALAAFPTGRRTYSRLRDGTFTGGNAVIVPGEAIERLSVLIDAAYRARKNPVGLAKLLGPTILIKAATRRLSIADIAQKMTQILGCRTGAIQMKDASIAFDIDKIDDYNVAQQALEQRSTD
jgi:GTP:adenosylcobinamide-phosphate guanylyltransferase